MSLLPQRVRVLALRALVVLPLLAGPGIALGAPGPDQTTSAAAPPADADEAQGAPGAGDPCLEGAGRDNPALERVRAGLYRGVCASSRWLDGFFGDARDYAEVYGQTYGRIGAGVEWNQRDDFGVDGFLRAKFPLPALGERYNAVLGRESEENFLDDNFDGTTFLPGAFSDENLDAVWYAGISYDRSQGRNTRTSLSVGLRISSPLNPYVKYRYRYFIQPHDSVLLQLRATPFWENQDGFGVTLAGDTDWSFTDGYMLRWANTFTLSEATEGVRWRSRLALFQVLNRKSAMRYELSVRGETGGIQPKLYGGKLTYRRALWRDWFFVETSAALFWSREEDPAEDCDACVGVTVGFEVAFGERYDRAIENSRDPLVSIEDGSQGPPGYR